MPDIKVGPLTRAEIQAFWESSVDAGYREPLIEAGEGGGFEVWTQAFAQLERVSKAIDVTTQAMFIAPWSGQSNPPGAGAARATVTLRLSRSKRLVDALVLGRGILVEETTTDEGENGGEVVLTGRRYELSADVVFHPGERGPIEVEAIAERPGYGYDNPLPATIRTIYQPGSVFENDLAEVVATNRPFGALAFDSSLEVIASAQPDMFVPDHVGQYVAFLDGANAGKIARGIRFVPPRPEETVPVGSGLVLELFFSAKLSPTSGTFLDGEPIVFSTPANGRAIGTFDPAKALLGFVLVNGAVPAVGATLTGSLSGATGTIQSILHSTSFASEAPIGGVGGAEWEILDWVADWGVDCTNLESPVGGKSPMLDELGYERKVFRSVGERDDLYSERIRQIADVVSPNAVKRALNRALEGYPWCLREAGQEGLPGFFFDGTNEPPSGVLHGATNDAYDVDCFVLSGTVSGTFDFQEEVWLENPTDWSVAAKGYFGRIQGGALVFVRKEGQLPASFVNWRVRGLRSGATLSPITAGSVPPAVSARRWRVWLDDDQFRGFFLVTLPPLSEGEFGFAYDVVGKSWAWDLPDPWRIAFDGYPYLSSRLYRRAYDAVDPIRAAGVGFQLRLDGGSCP